MRCARDLKRSLADAAVSWPVLSAPALLGGRSLQHIRRDRSCEFLSYFQIIVVSQRSLLLRLGASLETPDTHSRLAVTG